MTLAHLTLVTQLTFAKALVALCYISNGETICHSPHQNKTYHS